MAGSLSLMVLLLGKFVSHHVRKYDVVTNEVSRHVIIRHVVSYDVVTNEVSRHVIILHVVSYNVNKVILC